MIQRDKGYMKLNRNFTPEEEKALLKAGFSLQISPNTLIFLDRCHKHDSAILELDKLLKDISPNIIEDMLIVMYDYDSYFDTPVTAMNSMIPNTLDSFSDEQIAAIQSCWEDWMRLRTLYVASNDLTRSIEEQYDGHYEREHTIKVFEEIVSQYKILHPNYDVQKKKAKYKKRD